MTLTTNSNLLSKIMELIEGARRHVAKTTQYTMVHCYFEIGRMIVNEEQQGKFRADYGKKILQELSGKLTLHYGKGFSVDNLERMRQFYLVYSTALENHSRKSATLLRKSGEETKSATLLRNSENPTSDAPLFQLSWSHYLQLLRVEDPLARRFYEIEAQNGQWSVRWLGRQIASSLYERTALSKDKDKVIELSQHGNVLETPSDMLKEPYVLEFLGMEAQNTYTETDLESRLLTHLQDFLLELGNGFSFVGRQVRFSYEEEHFFVDLVFYNRLLRCFVLFDLKTTKLTHQDVGQMLMYVHYYDRNVKKDFENPTIGILLCKEKNEAIVKMTLPENENIFAAEYKLYLPEPALLQQKLMEWIAEEEH